jgi:hypothetical protein
VMDTSRVGFPPGHTVMLPACETLPRVVGGIGGWRRRTPPWVEMVDNNRKETQSGIEDHEQAPPLS